jgi:5-methylthioribose kinase
MYVPGLVGDSEKNKRLGIYLKKFIEETQGKSEQMKEYLISQTEQVSSIQKKQL